MPVAGANSIPNPNATSELYCGEERSEDMHRLRTLVVGHSLCFKPTTPEHHFCLSLAVLLGKHVPQNIRIQHAPTPFIARAVPVFNHRPPPSQPALHPRSFSCGSGGWCRYSARGYRGLGSVAGQWLSALGRGGGGGEGVWDPKFRVTKMARPHFPDCKFRCSHDGHFGLGEGGGVSKGGDDPPPCGGKNQAQACLGGKGVMYGPGRPQPTHPPTHRENVPQGRK